MKTCHRSEVGMIEDRARRATASTTTGLRGFSSLAIGEGQCPTENNINSNRQNFMMKGIALGFDHKLVLGALQNVQADTTMSKFIEMLIQGEGEGSPSVQTPCTQDFGFSLAEEQSIPPNSIIFLDGIDLAARYSNQQHPTTTAGIELCLMYLQENNVRSYAVVMTSTTCFKSHLPSCKFLDSLEANNKLICVEAKAPAVMCETLTSLNVENGFLVSTGYANHSVISLFQTLDINCSQLRCLSYHFTNDKNFCLDGIYDMHTSANNNQLSIGSSRSLPAASNCMLCPYGKKCTYGNKCKYYHPERGNCPQLSVTERIIQKSILEKRKLEQSMKGRNGYGALSPHNKIFHSTENVVTSVNNGSCPTAAGANSSTYNVGRFMVERPPFSCGASSDRISVKGEKTRYRDHSRRKSSAGHSKSKHKLWSNMAGEKYPWVDGFQQLSLSPTSNGECGVPPGYYAHPLNSDSEDYNPPSMKNPSMDGEFQSRSFGSALSIWQTPAVSVTDQDESNPINNNNNHTWSESSQLRNNGITPTTETSQGYPHDEYLSASSWYSGNLGHPPIPPTYGHREHSGSRHRHRHHHPQPMIGYSNSVSSLPAAMLAQQQTSHYLDRYMVPSAGENMNYHDDYQSRSMYKTRPQYASHDFIPNEYSSANSGSLGSSFMSLSAMSLSNMTSSMNSVLQGSTEGSANSLHQRSQQEDLIFSASPPDHNGYLHATAYPSRQNYKPPICSYSKRTIHDLKAKCQNNHNHNSIAAGLATGSVGKIGRRAQSVPSLHQALDLSNSNDDIITDLSDEQQNKDCYAAPQDAVGDLIAFQVSIQGDDVGQIEEDEEDDEETISSWKTPSQNGTEVTSIGSRCMADTDDESWSQATLGLVSSEIEDEP